MRTVPRENQRTKTRALCETERKERGMTGEEVMDLDRKVRNGSSDESKWVGLNSRESMSLIQEVYRLRRALQDVGSTIDNERKRVGL